MAQVEIFLYVVKPNKSPDEVEGLVPFRVSEKHIFFGPAEPAFRKMLRDRFMTYTDEALPENDIYMIGVNDRPKDGIRKILWVGRISRIMTFNVANSLLDDPEFASLENVEIKKKPGKNMSPLHIQPLDLVGRLSGYRHRSDLNSKAGRDGVPQWVKDVLDPRFVKYCTIHQNDLLLGDLSRSKEFLKRDCCFTCDNIFFAQGEGMEINSEFVSMLQEKQTTEQVDETALFGYKLSSDGKRTIQGIKGGWLHIRWNLGERMLDYVMRKREGE